MNAKKRILITGSAGFIGSNLMNALSAQGHLVWGVDNFSDYYPISMKRYREISLGLENKTLEVDISDLNALSSAFEKIKPEIVVNLAAQGGVRASRIDPAPYLISNQIGFLNVLHLSKDFGVEKFLYASSSSVYGDSQSAPFDETLDLPAPKSLYALSKVSNEIMARDFHSPEMLKIGMRFFTVYGPWGRPDMAMFRILASIKLQREFRLTASLDVKRDFTFVDDVSKVIESLISRNFQGHSNELINVAGGKPYSLNELFRILASKNQLTNIVQGKHDSLDVRLTHASIEKLERLGIYIPNTSLIAGVEQTFNWIESTDHELLSEWFDHHL